MEKKNEGLILPFTLIVLVLLSLMGIIMLLNSKNEMVMIGQARSHLDTFNATESSAMVATFLSRILLHPELGQPKAALRESAGKYPLNVLINESRFNVTKIMEDSQNQNFTDRYLETGWGRNDEDQKPHLSFKIGEREVSAAVINIDNGQVLPFGASLGVGDSYDSSAATAKHLTLVVTVRGINETNTVPTGLETNTLITTMYREII
jgi:hypothetical protein